MKENHCLIAFLTLLLGVLLGLGLLLGSGIAVAAPQRTAGPGDVVINEVAWGGTAASTADEWIELYNNTAAAIDLTGWTLAATDGNPTIALNGSVPAHGYYLLERTDDNTVSNVAADWIGSFGTGLSNTGETLELRDGASALIDSANGSGGAWPAGTTTGYKTMERINSAAADTDTNWATNDGVTRNGLDANSQPINGTPKARNSATPIPAADLSIGKTGSASVLPGAAITYTIAVSNVGTLDAVGVFITDVLPGFVNYQSDTSGYAVTEPTPGTRVWAVGVVGVASGTIAFQVGGLVSGGASGTLTNAVTVTTATTETVTADNHDSWDTAVGTVGTPQVLIAGVLYDGYQTNDDDEAVQLINVGTGSADLAGWRIDDDTAGTTCATFGSGTLAPQQRIWVAAHATSFATSFGFAPDYEVVETDPAVPNLSGTWPGYSNSGDEAVLRNAADNVMDAVVYKAGATSIIGWSGAAVDPYGVGREEGQILSRIPDEVTGLPTGDTNTAADWIQYTGDVAQGRRVLYPGWDLDPFFWPLTVTESASVTIGISPDNAYPVLAQTIARAQHSIDVEVYALRHPEIIAALVQKAQQGVSVRVLLEGGQVGLGTADPRWQQELWACQQIEAAGGQCWFMIHETADDIFNRYDYIHAKFIIVDDEWAVITSQNLSSSGVPSDDKANGTAGSRGVVLATNAPSVVAGAALVFARDLDAAHHNDILRWNTGYLDQYGTPDPAFTPVLTSTDYTTYTVRFPDPLALAGSFGFELFTAPEAALRQSDALLGLVARAGAGDKVLVEQLYEYADWGTDPVTDPNVRLEAYIAAARRGATVRILLNGGFFEAEYVDLTNNQETVTYVNGVAHQEGLDLRAVMGDPTLYGIHNKMVLVWLHDEGGYAHVGSINGSEPSNKVNREMALQIQSNDAYDYLARVFDSDWWISQPIHLPLVLRGYTPPPPPVGYLVISEVYYAGAVSTEWVEIYNPTQQTIDLSQYKIGDAERIDKYEAMYRFPDGTTIAPQGVIVVAFDGSQVFEADFEMSDKSDKPNMIRYEWGSGDWELRNAGDQVLLLGPANQAVDVLVWGDATYPGVNPHPGVGTFFTHSLERYLPYYDTNDCAIDFRDLYPPDPGRVDLGP
ncbi:MAG: lamin tail domain-containing protein [Chloroflexi bacterium]|nr:lamin tail domain-containing protein [Chloroflexota bacterium]MBU1746380.1 lamin tail domain-containing protein [Chloroflexota bacterium]